MLAIAYRGYPGSTGTPSEGGMIRDGEAAIAFVGQEAPNARVLVHGHSMGTGVAIATATRPEIGGLYLEAPYLSLLHLALARYPFLPAFVVRDPMRSDLRISAVKAPIWAVHGRRDAVVPIASGRALIARASEGARFIELAGDHVSILGQADAEAEAFFRSRGCTDN
jgi:uncharacterized protein